MAEVQGVKVDYRGATASRNILISGVYKVPYSPPGRGGEFVKSAGEEYQFVWRGSEYHGRREEYNVEKSERGSNIIFPLISGLLGRISGGEE